MKTLRLMNMEVQSSYDSIPSAFAMRPSPHFIAQKLQESLEGVLDFEAAFGAMRNKTFTAATEKEAIKLAHQELMTELSKQAGFQVGYEQAAVYYRPLGTSHITEYYLTKSSPEGALQPWSFAFTLNGAEVKGYVALMMFLTETTETVAKPQGEAKRAASAFVGPQASTHAGIGSAS